MNPEKRVFFHLLICHFISRIKSWFQKTWTKKFIINTIVSTKKVSDNFHRTPYSQLTSWISGFFSSQFTEHLTLPWGLKLCGSVAFSVLPKTNLTFIHPLWELSRKLQQPCSCEMCTPVGTIQNRFRRIIFFIGDWQIAPGHMKMQIATWLSHFKLSGVNVPASVWDIATSYLSAPFESSPCV